MSPITLSHLNALVSDAINFSLDASYWVVAEISEIRTAANGHCYIELVEKDANGGALLAKAPAHIWKNTWQLIKRHFEQDTSASLVVGMKILVEIEPSFHELYGYSLNIINIDPTYTMGDMAQQRAEILCRLKEDGVLTLNKELTLSHPILHIAVISSETAAGYGDFIQQIKTSPFRFHTQLFPAIMQGQGVEESIICALEKIIKEHSLTSFDCVCILRGGGAVSDLQGFESYMLAACVAQYPLPVFTGIGHERDETVLDLVAHTRMKTPTAVAAFLIDLANEEKIKIDNLEKTIKNIITISTQNERIRIDVNSHRLSLCATRTLVHLREKLVRMASRIEFVSHQAVSREHTRIAFLEKNIELANPEHILALGYSITTKDNHIVRNASDINKGDILETHLKNGRIVSLVTNTQPTS